MIKIVKMNLEKKLELEQNNNKIFKNKMINKIKWFNTNKIIKLIKVAINNYIINI